MSRQTELLSVDAAAIESLPTEAEWLEARRQGIGASEAAAVLGVSPYRSPLELYAEKLGLFDHEANDREPLEWGLLLQPVIVARYRRITGRAAIDEPPYTLRRSREHAFMVASLDALTTIDERWVPLEIKNVDGFKAGQWAEEPPVWVQVQAQHQMAVMGAERASVAALIGGNRFAWCDVERNDRFIAVMIEQERAFLDRLARKEPPPVDGSPGAREVLAQLYPRESPGLVVNLPDDAEAWDEQIQTAKGEMKKWGAVKDEAENRLRAAIAEAEAGVLPGGRVVYAYRTVTRKGYTVDASSHRELRRKEIRG